MVDMVSPARAHHDVCTHARLPTPPQWLAVTNHNFHLTERRRHYLRYVGGLAFFETSGPSVYRTYCAAGERLRLDPSAAGYWALHVKEDERHGRWMVEDAAVPLAHRWAGRQRAVGAGSDPRVTLHAEGHRQVQRALAQLISALRVVLPWGPAQHMGLLRKAPCTSACSWHAITIRKEEGRGRS